MSDFVTTVALVGIVIIVGSLLSGAVDRIGAPLVAAFIALGALLGPYALGLVDIGLHDPVLRSIATLCLALVLFADAVTLEVGEVRRQAALAWRLLGPGTLLVAGVVAVAARYLLSVSTPAAALLGAAVAATDPVLLRNAMRSRALPDAARLALRLETGMNDVVVLPVVMFAILAMGGGGLTASDFTRHAFGLLLLGPAAGAGIGWAGIAALRAVRSRVGVRRDYESLYAIGLAFSGYAAAEAVGGSGFLAAFATGLTVAWQDVELCDCFLEYGEASAEMLLLLTFVALGMSLIWTGLDVADVRTVAFTLIALFSRTLLLLPLLRGLGLDARERRLIALFGPRGLSTLLYVLLAVFAGVPGAERLFAISCLVVLSSIVVHGGGMAIFLRRQRLVDARATEPSEGIVTTAAGAPETAGVPLPERITIAEMRALETRGEDVAVVDARTARSYHAGADEARGALRIPPDAVVRTAQALRLTHHGTVVVYCA